MSIQSQVTNKVKIVQTSIMSFVVTKSSPPMLVAPSKPTPAGDIQLTPTDKSRLLVPFTSFHIFEHPIHEPANIIRHSLSQTLIHYYPIAGRLAFGATKGDNNKDVYVSCTGQGVAFVSATASCTLQELRFLHTPLAIPLADLAVRYRGCCGPTDPLLMMQVTEFTCGGYVVAVTWNHGITDAFGLAQFLQAVGEIARGLPSPSVVPVRHDDSLPDIPQLISAVLKRSPAAFTTSTKRVDFAYCDFTIPWSFIDRIKEEFKSRHIGSSARPCTTFQVVTAVIWQCRTRAINADPGVPAPLMFTANVRKFVGAKDGYYGNCVFSQLVEATSGRVANSAIVDVVRLIKDAKERIAENVAEVREMELDDELMGALCGYNMLGVSSWGGIGLDCIDFGGGRPARLVANVEKLSAPACFPCLPHSRTDHDGANVVAFCVTEEHVDKFLAELARLQ
ncbi:hypothetical protein PR202_ga30380 [Eleusine coracana subsp. coracana]|uniref:Uncharacterized protein n=1 Tax=Eleusine coracana subsp. coracana TaxID=191504 RepID=A0AAV5DPA6_ELECO|nr:hypothetical protein PR202_ga30380 [Eleusine coracana subsp. coracana]